MKHLFLALAGMALITSCDNTQVAGTKETNTHAAIADKNAENTKKVYRALETGDITGIDTLFTEDVIDHNGGEQGQDIVGRDSTLAMISKIHGFFDGLKLEMLHHATSADGEYHYSTVRMTGTAKQNPWGMPVGMKIEDTSVDVIKLRDGKAAEHWGFMSMQDVMEMMRGMSQQQSAADTAQKK